MEQLIKRWEEEYQKLEDKAEEYRYTNEHNFKKLTYKALQLKYCIKDLREQCDINGVVGRSEQLKAFLLWLDKDYEMGDSADIIVSDYIKSL